MPNDFLGCPVSFSKYNFKNKSMMNAETIRYFLSATQEIFKYSGLPDSIPARALELYLQQYGYCGISEIDGVLYPLYGNLEGAPDPYNMPTIFTFNNVALKKSGNLKIDEDCIIMKNDSMYIGLFPLISKYANLLTENTISMRMVDINSRISAIATATDTNTRDAFERYLKDIEEGKQGVALDSKFMEAIKTQPYGTQSTSHILIDLIEERQYLIGSFWNELGLQANYNMKREAINAAEVGMNDDVLRPKIDNMLRNRQECVKAVNKKYGTNISVELNSSWVITKTESDEVLEEEEEKEEEEGAEDEKL